MVVCICNGISDRDVNKVKDRCCTAKEVMLELGYTFQCGVCKNEIKVILEEK